MIYYVPTIIITQCYVMKDCSNYRTIALLSHASKMLLIILLNRLRQKFEDELPDEQAGFRRGRGTADMLCCIQNVIEKTLLMSERTLRFH